MSPVKKLQAQPKFYRPRAGSLVLNDSLISCPKLQKVESSGSLLTHNGQDSALEKQGVVQCSDWMPGRELRFQCLRATFMFLFSCILEQTSLCVGYCICNKFPNQKWFSLCCCRRTVIHKKSRNGLDLFCTKFIAAVVTEAQGSGWLFWLRLCSFTQTNLPHWEKRRLQIFPQLVSGHDKKADSGEQYKEKGMMVRTSNCNFIRGRFNVLRHQVVWSFVAKLQNLGHFYQAATFCKFLATTKLQLHASTMSFRITETKQRYVSTSLFACGVRQLALFGGFKVNTDIQDKVQGVCMKGSFTEHCVQEVVEDKSEPNLKRRFYVQTE